MEGQFRLQNFESKCPKEEWFRKFPYSNGNARRRARLGRGVYPQTLVCGIGTDSRKMISVLEKLELKSRQREGVELRARVLGGLQNLSLSSIDTP